MADLKLGKTPAKPDARDLRFAAYLEKTALPLPPPTFGHQDLVKVWGMLGNDTYGDCVWAGAAHEHELFTRESPTHADAHFTDNGVLSDYSACTGFSPEDPSTDQGTDMRVAANYRRKTGIIDAKGHRHKIGAYVALSPGNITQLLQALYVFSAAGIGIEFPRSAMDQFNKGQPWDYVPGSPIEGGHYIAGTGASGMSGAGGYIEIVTWGRVQPCTPRFLAHYMDEGFAYLSTETLSHGLTLEGFNLAQLTADLAAL